MRKSIEELKKLNTNNLLRFYKAERKRFYKRKIHCDCCGEWLWMLYPNEYKDLKIAYEEHKEFLNQVKKELNTREHVER